MRCGCLKIGALTAISKNCGGSWNVYAALISSCFRRPASRARQRVLCAGQEVMQPKKAGRSYHSRKIQTMIRCVETYPMACQWSPWTIWGSPSIQAFDAMTSKALFFLQPCGPMEGLCAEGLWQSMRQASSTMRRTSFEQYFTSTFLVIERSSVQLPLWFPCCAFGTLHKSQRLQDVTIFSPFDLRSTDKSRPKRFQRLPWKSMARFPMFWGESQYIDIYWPWVTSPCKLVLLLTIQFVSGCCMLVKHCYSARALCSRTSFWLNHVRR